MLHATTGTETARAATSHDAVRPLDVVMQSSTGPGVDRGRQRSPDLDTRDLDGHIAGMRPVLEVMSRVSGEYRTLTSSDTVLVVGRGIGTASRFLAARFACSVVGVDPSPSRIEVARATTDRTLFGARTTYHVAAATGLPLDDWSVDEVWMLDVGLHIRDGRARLPEIARILRPGGLLVMHDRTPAVATHAPDLASSLPRLIGTVEHAGFRVLTWRDTTERAEASAEALDRVGGHAGLLVARAGHALAARSRATGRR
jgi:SAM-dependent methyltransferase